MVNVLFVLQLPDLAISIAHSLRWTPQDETPLQVFIDLWHRRHKPDLTLHRRRS